MGDSHGPCECREKYGSDEDGTYPAIAMCPNRLKCAGLVKAAFNLRADELDKLRGLAERAGTTVTQALRVAISDAHIIGSLRDGGAKIYVLRPGDDMYELTWPPC